jgi:predicted DNA-binding transcriptional regulator AlpA
VTDKTATDVPKTNKTAGWPLVDPSRAVWTLRQFLTQTGLSKGTLYRMWAAGEGPRRTYLSTRRMGIRAGDASDWLDARSAG